MYGHQWRDRSISATEQFQRKRHKLLDLRCLLSAWQRFHDEQKVKYDLTDTQTHRHTDTTTTVKGQSQSTIICPLRDYTRHKKQTKNRKRDI